MSREPYFHRPGGRGGAQLAELLPSDQGVMGSILNRIIHKTLLKMLLSPTCVKQAPWGKSKSGC